MYICIINVNNLLGFDKQLLMSLTQCQQALTNFCSIKKMSGMQCLKHNDSVLDEITITQSSSSNYIINAQLQYIV